jgi:hypothetical protein
MKNLTGFLLGMLGLLVGLVSFAIAKEKTNKPLGGYSVVLVESFTVEKSDATKDFPAGEEVTLYRTTMAKLRSAAIFAEVIVPEQTAVAESGQQPPPTEGQRRLTLSCTVIGYSKGSSAARFATWPLGVGATKVLVRFVFRDAETRKEVFRTDRAGKFLATFTGGIAEKERQLSEVRGNVAEALLKEIRKNR